MSTTPTLTTPELIKEFEGDRCRCGKAKQPRQSFCRACYFKLSKPQRAALYLPFLEGYHGAYTDAVQALDR